MTSHVKAMCPDNINALLESVGSKTKVKGIIRMGGVTTILYKSCDWEGKAYLQDYFFNEKLEFRPF